MPQELKSNANRDRSPRVLFFAIAFADVSSCSNSRLFAVRRSGAARRLVTDPCEMKMELGVGVNEVTQRYWGMPLTEQHFASTNREWVECGYDVIRQVSEEWAVLF